MYINVEVCLGRLKNWADLYLVRGDIVTANIPDQEVLLYS